MRQLLAAHLRRYCLPAKQRNQYYRDVERWVEVGLADMLKYSLMRQSMAAGEADAAVVAHFGRVIGIGDVDALNTRRKRVRKLFVGQE